MLNYVNEKELCDALKELGVKKVILEGDCIEFRGESAKGNFILKMNNDDFLDWGL